METTENNKLIAEFMHLETSINHNSSEWYEKKIISSIITENANELNYHKSWDWLMPVVQRIECTSTDNKDNSDNFFNVAIEVFECNINGVDTSINISHNAQTKIKATYEAVVEFIKEYNKQN